MKEIKITSNGIKQAIDDLVDENERLQDKVYKLEDIIKEVREDLYQVVKWCTENKHNEDTIERYLVVDYGTTVGKINEIRTKLDKEVN